MDFQRVQANAALHNMPPVCFFNWRGIQESDHCWDMYTHQVELFKWTLRGMGVMSSTAWNARKQPAGCLIHPVHRFNLYRSLRLGWATESPNSKKDYILLPAVYLPHTSDWVCIPRPSQRDIEKTTDNWWRDFNLRWWSFWFTWI